ncbi:GNAT family N-acetyltransferase [Dehalococcoidia bacterium]|nr:GNAT family N-acetyltransferase [Dehalococcoidia bacterium]
MGPTIRLAELKDIPCVATGLKGFSVLLQHELLPDQQLALGIERLIADENTDILVAIGDHGDCVGFLQQRYRYSIWVAAPEANIEDVFVGAQSRKEGFGRKIMDAAIARAIARGCKRVTLDVIETNYVAIRIYEQMGFSCVRRRSISEGDPVTEGRQLFMVRMLT